MEARTEAQQDPQYLLRGDVSIYFFNSNWVTILNVFVHAALLLSFIEAVNVVTELSVQTLVVCGTPPVIPY